MPILDVATILPRLRRLQADLRSALIAHMQRQAPAVWSRSERDQAGDTIFGIDVAVEDLLLEHCRDWGREQHFTLLAEGLDPDGVGFGERGRGGPPFRLLVDPIDGTRGLMFDKRSAWCLCGAAPDRGTATRLADIEVAVMTELPTTRMAVADCLWAVRTGGAGAERHDLRSGAATPLPLRPSQVSDVRHGFASVASYFPGGKELTARIEEDILAAALGGWNPQKAEVYSDQYISSGGQLAELTLGRDRFVLDIRPLVHRHLGFADSLCSKPYDLCTALVAQEAGCVVTAADSSALDAPLDLTTNVGFAGYANATLAQRLQPIVQAALRRHLG